MTVPGSNVRSHDEFPDDESAPCSPAELAELSERIEGWAQRQLDLPIVLAVERADGDQPIWFVRLQGEEKSVFTVWFMLRQRSLWVETYLMPAPMEPPAPLYEYLLRRNQKMFGMAFGIGDEDGIYLTGQIRASHINDVELDRLLGSAYMATEQHFRTAMRLGLGDRFRP